jgi:glycosyltransferase involved in cell wall biosynthesis
VKKSIVFVTPAYDACAWYRCHVPGIELQKKGLDVCMVLGRDLDACEDADIVVYQRATGIQTYKDIKYLKSKGKYIVYEIDDDLWHLHPNNPGRRFWSNPLNLRLAVDCMREADLVTTTTKSLRKALLKYNSNVTILPNCLPDEHWPLNRKKDKKGVIIGWAGSLTHYEDLKIIKEVVEVVLAEFHNTELHLAGMEDYPFKENVRIKKLESVNLENYPKLISMFDIALAPLTDDLFNRCKSDLKFLEYAASGCACIASKVAAYDGTVKQGETGFLAKNSKDWLKYLRRLIQDKELRVRMSNNARKYAETRFISKNIWRWEEAYGL